MVCDFAMSDVEKLERRGFVVPHRDVIRLNALGCIAQAAQNKKAVRSTYYLPRVAAISPTIAFRQPTVGHDIWLSKISRLISDDLITAAAVKAFALSRPPTDLPDPDDPESITKAVETFAKECRDFTREQIFAALDYVIYGGSDTEGECPAAGHDDDDGRIPDGSEGQDWKYCLSIGRLVEGRIALFGLNQADVEKMTRRQLEDAIKLACAYHKIEIDETGDEAVEDYYNTLDEITRRLENAKGECNG